MKVYAVVHNNYAGYDGGGTEIVALYIDRNKTEYEAELLTEQYENSPHFPLPEKDNEYWPEQWYVNEWECSEETL